MLLLGVSHAHSCANIQELCESKWAEQIVHLSLTKTLGSLGMEVTNHPFRFPCLGHVLFLASPRQNPWTGWRKAWKSCESGPTWRWLPAFARVSCFSMSSIIIFICIIRHWHLGKFWGNTNVSRFLYRFFRSPTVIFLPMPVVYPTSLRKGRGEIPGSREKKPDADEWRASPGDFTELQVPWQGGLLRVYRGEFNEVSERYCSKWIQYHIISPVVYGRDINLLPSGMHDIQVWVKKRTNRHRGFQII